MFNKSPKTIFRAAFFVLFISCLLCLAPRFRFLSWPGTLLPVLQEIAEMSGVSRSAVHDTIRRCEKELQTYEDKLHLSASYQKRLKLYGQIRARGDNEISRLLDLCIDTEND